VGSLMVEGGVAGRDLGCGGTPVVRLHSRRIRLLVALKERVLVILFIEKKKTFSI